MGLREHRRSSAQRTKAPTKSQWRSLATAACLSLFTILPASAQVGLGTAVIASGGSSESAGACLKLHSAIGEPVAGNASGGAFNLTSGYWAGIDPRSRDDLFNTGFEECL